MKRNLSGIYFRHQQPDGSWDNVCFEDLPVAEQDRVMTKRSAVWLKSLAKQLAVVLKEVGNLCDVVKE